MDLSSMVDLRSCASLIAQDFADALELFRKWRTKRGGKRDVGQEECENSLHEGSIAVEQTLTRLSQQYGAGFDRGDMACINTMKRIRGRFREGVVDLLTRGVAGKLLRAESPKSLDMRPMSETTRKETIEAMYDLSRRIKSGIARPHITIAPGDVLPHMPLPPMRPTPAQATSTAQTQAPLPNGSRSNENRGSCQEPGMRQPPVVTTYPASADTSRMSLGLPYIPFQRPNNAPTPLIEWIPPVSGGPLALVKTRVPTAGEALTWMKDMLPTRPTRQYYDDIAPVKPIPAVIPTFRCDDDAMDILEEGRRATDRLWDSAKRMENDRLRLHAHSAPIPDQSWESIFGIDVNTSGPEDRPQTPEPSSREASPPEPDEKVTETFLRPVLPGARSTSAYGGRRNRSEPLLDFSLPPLSSRRHVSGPVGS